MERYENEFNDNENDRIQTFSSNENARKEQELEREQAEAQRQQAESQRQSTFETNESQRQSTFETAEQSRESAEAIRAENEQARNMTSVEEFTKLQDAIGGRNLVPNSDFTTGTGGWVGYYGSLSNVDGGILRFISDGTNPAITRMEYPFTIAKAGIYTLTIKVKATVPIWFRNFVNATISNGEVTDTGNVWTTITTKFTVDTDNTTVRFRLYLQNAVAGSTVEFDWFKVEKGEESTPYSKAPEDYTVVPREDYYNYVKLMNNFKDNQFNQLKNAVIALGGTI